jgi:hypothetical protein
MRYFVAIIAVHALFVTCAEDLNIHLPLHRRGGRFARHEDVNLTQLLDVLNQVEIRYASTRRSIENNRLSREWIATDDVLDGDALLSQTKNRGPW